jgi:hypothetical protein
MEILFSKSSHGSGFNSQANERSQLAWLGFGLLALAVLKYTLIGASLLSVFFLILGAIFLISSLFFRQGGRPKFIIVKKTLYPIAKKSVHLFWNVPSMFLP